VPSTVPVVLAPLPMRSLAITLFLLLASSAVADVGPRPPACTVPAACVTCTTGLDTSPDGGDGCAAGALDAGLRLADCTDHYGLTLKSYYCPASTPAYRSCGCGAAEGLAAVALLGLFPLLRRRSR